MFQNEACFAEVTSEEGTKPYFIVIDIRKGQSDLFMLVLYRIHKERGHTLNQIKCKIKLGKNILKQ